MQGAENKEVEALNEAIVGGSKRAAYYGGMALLAAFLVLFFIAVLGKFIDTGAPRYLIPSLLWGAVAYFGVTAIWNRLKP
jgi:tryptophan-rich sensory protein